MKSLLPPGLRIAFLAPPQLACCLPLSGEWASLKFFDVTRGWARAATEAAFFRPELTYVVLDDAFDPSALKGLSGFKVGMVTRPPHGKAGPWDLAGWRERGLDLITWYEPPPYGEASAAAMLPLPVDRSRIKPPQLQHRGIVVPRWAAPAPAVMEKLCEHEEVIILEPQGSMERQLELLDANGIFVCATYDATGRLDPLPLQAMARGLLVIAMTDFPPLWGIEAEDDFLLRPEDKLLATIDEVRRIPDTARAVRMRAYQKVAEFFDADEVFKRLTFDMFLELDAAKVVRPQAARQNLRRVP